MKLVPCFVLSSVIFDYDYSYVFVLFVSFGICKTRDRGRWDKFLKETWRKEEFLRTGR